ncbi:MAG: hypothetical protein IT577_24395 [Verrucomicrobiae bacterium]|nr:hypothetical protein [Verrucomicrobiae bacterium]
MSAKERILRAVRRLHDEADFWAIAEEIAFLAALDRGKQDTEAGRVVSNEAAEKTPEPWIST